MIKRTKPRSAHAQLQRITQRWPRLRPQVLEAKQLLVWVGPLRGFQREYQVTVQWSWLDPKSFPHVFLLDPVLKPRSGSDFIDIPHLLMDRNSPEDSALCLFDPDAGQWNSTMWISDTTVPWASEWLHHYEFWHLDGIWRGANAPGPISVGEILRQQQEAANGTGA